MQENASESAVNLGKGLVVSRQDYVSMTNTWNELQDNGEWEGSSKNDIKALRQAGLLPYFDWHLTSEQTWLTGLLTGALLVYVCC